MNLPRISLALVAGLAGSALLTGCGSDSAPIPSESQARTAACRGYVLAVGKTDLAAAKNASDQAGAGADVEGIEQSLTPVRVAAISAGTTAGLAEKDFALFRAVVDGVDSISAAVSTLDDGSTLLTTAAIAPLTRAVNAVHKRCY